MNEMSRSTIDKAAPSAERARAQVAAWLGAVAVLVLAMILLGGLTRLTQSGLSITEWRPVTGALPPLSDTAWVEEFAKYQRIPEYQLINKGMTLAAFKSIYWWEWSHRLLGRLIGLVFVLPFLYFVATKRIERALVPRLAVIFLLGGAQGALGWYMVKSGLSVRTDVSQYRLAAHLAAAFALLGAVLWTIFDLMRPAATRAQDVPRARALALGFLVLLSCQILMGAFVAGLDAGFAYNTWPLMNRRLVPEEAHTLSPWILNLFETPAMAQFVHRCLAYLILAGAFALWLDTKRCLGERAPASRSAGLVLGVVALQVMLGIITLLAVMPIPLAAAHQLCAAILFAVTLYHLHGVSPGAGSRWPGSGPSRP